MSGPPFSGRGLRGGFGLTEGTCPRDLALLVRGLASDDPEPLHSVLRGLQQRHGHIPERYLGHIATQLKTTRGAVYRAAFGGTEFTFAPPPDRLWTVCVGTSCGGRGGVELLRLAEELAAAAAAAGRPAPAVRSTSCLGLCRNAPVVETKDGHLLRTVPADLERLAAGGETSPACGPPPEPAS